MVFSNARSQREYEFTTDAQISARDFTPAFRQYTLGNPDIPKLKRAAIVQYEQGARS